MICNDDAAVNYLAELSEAETTVILSALTVFEVRGGLRGESAQYRERFDATIENLTVVLLDESDARRAWDIQYDLLDRGERIGARDMLISGTALGRSGPRVLTRTSMSLSGSKVSMSRTIDPMIRRGYIY